MVEEHKPDILVSSLLLQCYFSLWPCHLQNTGGDAATNRSAGLLIASSSK